MTATTRSALLAAIPLLAVAGVALVLATRSTGSKPPAGMQAPASSEAAATWAAGERKAPPIALRDQHGRRISLASLRGRPVLVTFIDPLCQDFCPIEAQHLSDVVRGSRVKPIILAVSVNTAGNAPRTLALDRRKWNVAPQWRWGIGSGAQLAQVWKRYGIAVVVTHKQVAGASVQDVTHTEATYLVDANGWERALFIWPYEPSAVSQALGATS